MEVNVGHLNQYLFNFNLNFFKNLNTISTVEFCYLNRIGPCRGHQESGLNGIICKINMINILGIFS